MVCAGWFLLSRADKLSVFSSHGPLAFPIVLESWMFADVAATNVMGSDAGGALAALPDGVRLRRYLDAKRLVLWVLVAPVCSTIALIIGIDRHRYLAAVSVALILLVLPIGVLMISTCVGVLWPYHPRSLRWRVSKRRNIPQVVRWLVLVIGPYSLVPAISTALLIPAGIATRVLGRADGISMRESHFVFGTAVACLTSLLVAFCLHNLTARLAEVRAAGLTSYLSNPDRG